MKKLMFAAAVVACATVGLAEGEIYSNNIVGYAENEDALNPSGGTQLSSQFVNVGNDGKFKIGDLKPFTKVASAQSLEYNLNLQIQNDDGTCDDENNLSWNGSNWEDANSVDASDRLVDIATGFKVFSYTDEAYIQSAGQVAKCPVTIPLTAGLNIGNPFPVDVTFGSITVTGDTYGYSVNAQIQNDDGTCDDENNFSWNGSSWEDGNSQDVSTRILKRGTSVRVFAFADDMSLYIPVPDVLK